MCSDLGPIYGMEDSERKHGLRISGIIIRDFQMQCKIDMYYREVATTIGYRDIAGTVGEITAYIFLFEGVPASLPIRPQT